MARPSHLHALADDDIGCFGGLHLAVADEVTAERSGGAARGRVFANAEARSEQPAVGGGSVACLVIYLVTRLIQREQEDRRAFRQPSTPAVLFVPRIVEHSAIDHVAGRQRHVKKWHTARDGLYRERGSGD